MKLVFDKKLIDKATVTPEQIEKVKKDGSPFRFEDTAEGIAIVGFNLNGIVYITDVQNLSKAYQR